MRGSNQGNAILVTKQASGSAKIDALMAAFNAIALMVTKPQSSQPSVFWI
jgi:phage terminase large subunit-like protein